MWEDFTDDRSRDVAYQNTSPDMIAISIVVRGDQISNTHIFVDHVKVAEVATPYSGHSAAVATLQAVVPPGSWYRLCGMDPLRWMELR